MVIAEHQHLREEPDPAGPSREEGERGERVPVGAAALVDDRGRHRHVLAAGQVVVAKVVGDLGEPADLLDARGPLPRRERLGERRHDRCGEADLHRHHILSGSPGVAAEAPRRVFASVRG